MPEKNADPAFSTYDIELIGDNKPDVPSGEPIFSKFFGSGTVPSAK
jgi:hypothetical protein